MNQRLNISSGGKFEDIVGYSRAVRVGNWVEVAGTTATDEQGNIVGLSDPYLQAQTILNKIETALKAAGSGFQDVVRTRIYLTDIRHWPEVGKAHGEVFRAIKPANVLVQVAALVDPQMLVEIECSAIVTELS